MATLSGRGDPQVVLATADGDLRDELVGVLGDLCPLVTPPNPARVLSLLGRHPSARVLIVVEEDGDGALDVLQAAKAQQPDLAVLIISPRPTIDHATEAIRRGAEDFVPVPFSREVLRKEIDRMLEAAKLRDGVAELQNLVSTSYGFERIVSTSARMRPVFERALAAARSDTPVLITGETGTGKELLARAIHANSRRRSRPFVPVNCAALPRDLVESELFGHRRGAFSGAHMDHPGLFVSAHRGTLLLDELGELPAETQAKLLRVLQDGEVRPVGGLESRQVDVRVIGAANRSLEELRSGVLRQDLFFRLSVLVVEVPPLRERLEDVPGLVQHFLNEGRTPGSAQPRRVAPDALQMLMGYPYPGNVRELENLVHTLCATLPVDQTEIRVGDVRAWLRRQGTSQRDAPAAPGLPVNLRQLEAWAIRTALEHARGNKSRAAALLGISRDTLYRKLHELAHELSDSTTGGLSASEQTR